MKRKYRILLLWNPQLINESKWLLTSKKETNSKCFLMEEKNHHLWFFAKKQNKQSDQTSFVSTNVKKNREEEDVKWHHSVTISKILTVKSSTKQVTKFILQMICKEGRKRTYKLKVSSRDIAINNNAWTLKKWKWKLLSCVRLFETPWTVHGILQARILEWVAIPFSRGSSWPRNWTEVSCIAGRFLTNWAIREAQ